MIGVGFALQGLTALAKGAKNFVSGTNKQARLERQAIRKAAKDAKEKAKEQALAGLRSGSLFQPAPYSQLSAPGLLTSGEDAGVAQNNLFDKAKVFVNQYKMPLIIGVGALAFWYFFIRKGKSKRRVAAITKARMYNPKVKKR